MHYPSGIYLFEVINGINRTVGEVYSNLTIKTSDDVVLVSLLLTLNRFCTQFRRQEYYKKLMGTSYPAMMYSVKDFFC